jgi:transcriptional adapter 3
VRFLPILLPSASHSHFAPQHSIPIKPPPPGGASAFYVPSNPLVPPKPPLIVPTPTAKRQADVTGDFSVAKPGQQIAHSTFQNWVDAYLRPFGEDDLAFLAAKVRFLSLTVLSTLRSVLTEHLKQPEDIAPYLIPPLGKHYLDKWEEEDSELPNSAPHHPHHRTYTSPLEPPVLPRLRPDALTEDALSTESVFLGPLSERLVAALAVDPSAGTGWDEENGGGEPAWLQQQTEEGPVPPKLPMDAVDLEERIKRELRFIGLLPDEEVRCPSSFSPLHLTD